MLMHEAVEREGESEIRRNLAPLGCRCLHRDGFGFLFCGIKTLGSRVMGLSCQEVLFYRFLNLGFWACRSQDLQLYS